MSYITIIVIVNQDFYVIYIYIYIYIYIIVIVSLFFKKKTHFALSNFLPSLIINNVQSFLIFKY